MSGTLHDLKVAISQSLALGEIPPHQQRIFHLGRELKSSGRSLENLGVGRLGVTVLHVHASIQEARTILRPKKIKERAQVVDLVDDSDDDCVVVDEAAAKKSKKRRRAA